MSKNAGDRSRTQPMTRRKRILFVIGMMACLGVAVLVGSEILVRVVAPQSPVPKWNTASKEYGIDLKKNFYQHYAFPPYGFAMDVKTNSIGLRDDEIPPAAGFPGQTILFIGDSFAFGYAINVPDRLDRKLAARCREAGVAVRTIDAGHPGWGTLQEAAYARAHYAEFNPDVLVLVFCGNDPSDDDTFTRGEVTIDAKQGFVNYPGKMFLIDHLHAYRYLLKRTAIARRQSHLKHQMGANPKAPLDRQSVTIITPEQWDRTLTEIRDFARDFTTFKPGGIMLVVATDPTNQETRNHLRRLTDGRSLFYVDTSEAVESISDQARALPWDRHWSQLMHYVSAEYLYRTLAEKRGWPAPAAQAGAMAGSPGTTPPAGGAPAPAATFTSTAAGSRP